MLKGVLKTEAVVGGVVDLWRLEMVSSRVLMLCTHIQFYAFTIRHGTVIPKRTRI